MTLVAIVVILCILVFVRGFPSSKVDPRLPIGWRNNFSALYVHNVRDADIVEQLVGGVRYSLVPMPESMKATTAYVGNLCEFVSDQDLSDLFAQVSTLHSIPSCVVRKPDTTSLQYGFVSFPSEVEKIRAIIQFNGFEWKGRPLKVECIRDHPKRGSVRIPVQLVEYVSGRRTPERLHSLQRATHKRQKQPKQKSMFRLNDKESAEYERATRRGYLSISHPHKRSSSLVKAHRTWCTTKNKPQIILYKTVGDSTLDQVVLDVTTVRWKDHSNGTDTSLIQYRMQLWKLQITNAAKGAKMDLCGLEDDSSEDDEFSLTDCMAVENADAATWIANLSTTKFTGERTDAKAMASELAQQWNIPLVEDLLKRHDENDKGRANGKQRPNRKLRTNEYQPRRRGGGHRQVW